jgi:alpha-mannosidase
MASCELYRVLEEQIAVLRESISIPWRYPDTLPDDPLAATPDEAWLRWEDGAYTMRAQVPNWMYADVVVPDTHGGVELRGSIAHIVITGWDPFTLWVNGVEQYQETHVWHATGPLADPLPDVLEPGRSYRLILRFTSDDVACLFGPIAVKILPLACVEVAIELGAALAQLRLAEKLAATDDERALVQRAAACLAIEDVQAQRWEAVTAAIAAMEALLAPLSARAKALQIHLVGHSHIDMDWMWTWPDTVHCVRRDFKAVTELMLEDPRVTFVHSQVPTYQIIEEMDPDVFAHVRQFIAEGRWENAAGTWVEGDLNMADGEAIARQMRYAKAWTPAHLGTQAKVLWEPDTFGHPGNMPQLARLGEFDCYYHMRGNPGKQDNWPIRMWQGIDGTSILTFSTRYNNTLAPEIVLTNCLFALDTGLRTSLHVWGLGDHGGGMSRYQLATLRRYRHKPLIPTIEFSTIAQVYHAVQGEREQLPSNSGETFHLFEGCFTTHAKIKWYNRRCEGALLAAETLSTLAGLDRRDLLREAWIKTLFNQFHDILDGAAIHDAYTNAYQRAEESLASAQGVVDEALQALLQPSAQGEYLVLVNPLGFTRTEPLRVALPETACGLLDERGKAVAIQRIDEEFLFIAEEVPAFSQKTYRIVREPLLADLPAVSVSEEEHYFTVETPLATARVHRASGTIASYYDNTLQRELVAYGVMKHLTFDPYARRDLALNLFQILDESPNSQSAWLIHDILREENLLRGAEVTLRERGPVFARFTVKHTVRASTIDEEIIFYRDFPRVDFFARIDWQEKGDKESSIPHLKVSFAADLAAARLRCEGPFSLAEHAANGLDQPTQKWADLSGDELGFTLFNDAKYGCDALGGRLRMSLLRSPYWPDATPDNGAHVIRFAFAPHGAGATVPELVRQGMAFNRPLLAVRSDSAAEMPALTMRGAESVVCTAYHTAEQASRRLIRFFEAGGTPCRLWFSLGSGIVSAKEVNFLEHATGGSTTLEDGGVVLEFHPYEVKSVVVACAG